MSPNPKSSTATVIHTLVVVGDQLLQAAIERQLQQVGHASASAAGVREAIDRLRREPFDVVLCQLHPDGSEGTELLQYMTSYYPSTPVVVICEALSPEFRGQYEGGGAVRIVEKPINLGKLVEIIEACGPHKGFFGNQIEVEFFDYVQMVAVSARDKQLVVTTRAGNGIIWFEHGDIVHAQFHDFRGEQAFYKMLAVGRGTYREVFFRPPPQRTIVRPSMHLLMEAARQADEGILGTTETVEAEEEKKPKKRPPPEPEPSDSLSMMREEDMGEPPPRAAEPARTRAPMPKPDRPSTPPRPPPGSASASTSGGRRPSESRSDGRVADSRTDNRNDNRNDGRGAGDSLIDGGRPGDGRPGDIDMAGVADSAIARFDELTMPSDDDEMEADRNRGRGPNDSQDGVPQKFRRVQTLVERVPGRPTPVSMPAVGARITPVSMPAVGRATPTSMPATPSRATPASVPARHTPTSMPATPSRATPTSTPVPRPTGAGARPPLRPDARPIKKAASVDLLDDPETRDLMLGQFWQFEGVNGVAIISSTGKVIAEDMRNNSTVVTLAGFYMRGAARIARTLGYNVFDGVIARAANGQQMIMVGMGATSAVLSVAPGHDPEVIRDAIMGVDTKR